MPKRDNTEVEKIVATKIDVPEGLMEIATLGANYVRLKKDETKLKAEITKQNGIIKDKVTNSELYELNGKHKEVYAPLGDGMNEVFVQIQTRESVSTVDDIIARVRQKVGDKAENFIMVREVLHDNALEAMLNQGLITNDDILEWTSVKETESLIVKINKKRK